MKLVDILARELKVWPNDAKAVLYGDAGRLAYFDLGIGYRDCLNVHPDAASEIEPGFYEITRAQWQAAVDALKDEKVAERNGEGLPPIGLKVEAWYSMDTFPGWKPFKLKYLSEESVVFECSMGETRRDRETFDRWALTFRPIRTPEQIAAYQYEEDAAEIAKILSDLKDADEIFIAKTLLDCGYRRFEIVES